MSVAWTTVPSVRIGTERYVVRIFGTRFNLDRYVERISVRNLLVRYEIRILARDFNWYGTWYGIWSGVKPGTVRSTDFGA